MVKDYNTTLPENSLTWTTSGLTPGTYYVAVWARSAGIHGPEIGSVRRRGRRTNFAPRLL